MDYDAYRDAYLVQPAPTPKFDFTGLHGITLYFADYKTAVAYYTDVLGDPAYVEGEDTRGWRLGNTWLTLLAGGSGHPQNMEVSLIMPMPAEAERLQQAFIDAGGSGTPPSDQLMYHPVRACPVTDPFGTDILIYSIQA